MIIKKPTDCTEDELNNFKNLVIEGGQVDSTGLENRINQCKFLGFFYNDKKELVGISAIKTKTKHSVEAIKLKAGISDGKLPIYELGYSVTKQNFRGQGINRAINDKLLEAAKTIDIYATTDNDTMRKYLIERGFSKKGKSFKGRYNENLDYFEK